ncbi:SCO family protein [Methylobacterium sp. J-076]|uniref:SCO family protein n=1 Tax=Methylobacterium sp. J-076 TaxID=2836655 RepID=UPI001FB94689|nr:SCO family protein [Methylobacterium sp. J-076]MCJ2011325.1 SCO family protein [Methylobacterium sp. J-076]
MRRALLPILAFCVGLLGITAAAFIMLKPESAPIGTPAVGGPFTLVNQDGRTVTEKDFKGATHLVFFGFTHCPDVCPTTLQQISDVLAALGPKGQAMKVAFVTVDPERDDPASLKTYLSSFDPRITGLTGTPEQIAATEKAFRAYARKVPDKNGDYVMEHTALVYVMDAQNRFLGALDLSRPPEQTAAELAKKI